MEKGPFGSDGAVHALMSIDAPYIAFHGATEDVPSKAAKEQAKAPECAGTKWIETLKVQWESMPLGALRGCPR